MSEGAGGSRPAKPLTTGRPGARLPGRPRFAETTYGLQAADAAILAAVADGRPAAFELLVARHLNAIHGYVARRIGSLDADTVTVETVEVAYRRADPYRSLDGSARPWLLGIATNLLLRHAERETEMYRSSTQTGVDPVRMEAGEWADSHTVHVALAAALADMTQERRDALLLRAFCDLSREGIARAMDVPVRTVEGWLRPAREAAATAMAAVMPEIDDRGVDAQLHRFRTPAPDPPSDLEHTISRRIRALVPTR